MPESVISSRFNQGKASPVLRISFCFVVILLIVGRPIHSEDSKSGWKLLTFVEAHMGTRFTVRTWVEDGRESELVPVVKAVFSRIAQLDQALSDYLPESEINLLAKAPVDQSITVSDDLFRLFSTAETLARETDGAFDITAGPLIRLWRMSRKNDKLPTEKQLLSAKARTGYQLLELNSEAQTITKHTAGMLFDAGGIAKGYASDAALKILRESGFPRSLVAASGDIAVGEPPPGESGWRVGIETLDIGHDLKDLQAITLVNQAISTSGDSRQYWEHDGVRYSHIISTKTGLGLTERIGASVIAPDATTSDSYATAVVLLGVKEGLQFIWNKRGIECQIVLMHEGKEVFLRSDGFPSPAHPSSETESSQSPSRRP